MVLYHSNKLSFAELLRGKIYFLRDHISKRILATFSSGELKGLKLLLINDYITLHGYNFTQAKQRIKSTYTNVYLLVSDHSVLKRSL